MPMFIKNKLDDTVCHRHIIEETAFFEKCQRNGRLFLQGMGILTPVSINRTHEILSSVFNIPLATGTIKNMVSRCAESLKDTYERIRLTMTSLGLLHCDETGTRVDGKTCWVHVASDQDYTYLTINQKRGQIGVDAAYVLPHARGTIVHDCWGSYWKYQDVTPAICCAHLLRELNGVIENHPEQTWAVRFKKLLIDMKKVRDKALLSDKDEVSYYHRHRFDVEYMLFN